MRRFQEKVEDRWSRKKGMWIGEVWDVLSDNMKVGAKEWCGRNILDYIIRAATSRRSGSVGSTAPLVSTPGRVAKAMSFPPLFQQVELQFELHLKLFDY